MADEEVLNAYGARASDIAAALGTDVAKSDSERIVIESWAASVHGGILDAGSGTGRWTGHLARLGFDVEGIEPVAELVKIARSAHPSAAFRQQTIADLATGSKRWSGILAWYSLIHMAPSELAATLEVVHRVLNPGGTLLMSYFHGPALEIFQHPVALAFRWPAQDLSDAMSAAGLTPVSQHADPHRPHAFVLAQKTAT